MMKFLQSSVDTILSMQIGNDNSKEISKNHIGSSDIWECSSGYDS